MTQSTHQSLSYCRRHRVDSIPIDWCCSLRWVLDLLPVLGLSPPGESGSSSGMIFLSPASHDIHHFPKPFDLRLGPFSLHFACMSESADAPPSRSSHGNIYNSTYPSKICWFNGLSSFCPWKWLFYAILNISKCWSKPISGTNHIKPNRCAFRKTADPGWSKST